MGKKYTDKCELRYPMLLRASYMSSKVYHDSSPTRNRCKKYFFPSLLIVNSDKKTQKETRKKTFFSVFPPPKHSSGEKEEGCFLPSLSAGRGNSPPFHLWKQLRRERVCWNERPPSHLFHWSHLSPIKMIESNERTGKER